MLLEDLNAGQVDWGSMTFSKRDTAFEAKLLTKCERCLFLQHVDRTTQFQGVQRSFLDLHFTHDPSNIFNLSYQKPLKYSDHLVIEFTLASSLIELKLTRVLKQYQKLIAKRALEMAVNLLRLSQLKFALM